MPLKMFIHGLESSNQGTKSIFFNQHYSDMVIPDFNGSLQERMKKLNGILSEKTAVRLVGSSFGGLMASIFAMENEPKVERLILLAPAINLIEFTPYKKKKLSIPVWIYHGRQDSVIPIKDVEKVANNIFECLYFNAVDDDHNLHKTFTTIGWESHLV